MAGAAGRDVDDLGPACAGVGIDPVATIGDYETCLARQQVCTSEALVKLELPRLDEMFRIAGARAASSS